MPAKIIKNHISLPTDNTNQTLSKALNDNSGSNDQDPHGNSALISAVLNKTTSISTIKTLIKNNADLNVQNNSGYTALMYAFQLGSQQVATVLAHAGANFNLENKYGKTAKIIAFENNYSISGYFELESTSKQKKAFTKNATALKDLQPAASTHEKINSWNCLDLPFKISHTQTSI